MEENPNNPSPPSSSSHGTRNEDVAGPDQTQEQQQSSTTANDRPKSFADAVRPPSKEKLRSAWGQIRARTERVEAEGDQPLAVAFTHHGTEREGAERILAIPYDRTQHSVADVLQTAEAALPSAIICDYSTAGVLFLLFESKEERDRVAATPLEGPSGTLRAMPAIRSIGTRIRIRVDDMNIASISDRRGILTSVFGGYGKILHINDHALKGSKLLVASFDFVLELPQGTSPDLTIPRVASVMGQNVLFMWNSAPFCLRCGSDAHTKMSCPRPLDFKVRNDPALAKPLMARAFADPKAAPREAIRTTQNTPTAAPSLAPSKSKGEAPLDTDWTIVGPNSQSGKKRGRRALAPVSSLGGITSASDSDSPKPSRKQSAPRNPPKERLVPISATASEVTPTTTLAQSAPRIETEAPILAPTTLIETAPEVPVSEPSSGDQDAPTRANLVTQPQTSDDTSEGGDQDSDMPAVSALPHAPTAQTVEPAVVQETSTPTIDIIDVDYTDNDVDMTTKLDAQKAKIAEKKVTRDRQAKTSGTVDRLFASDPAGAGKKSKAKERPAPKTTTRASAVPLDANGVPQVTAAAHPLG
ncbi:hypothetical protein BGZ75_000584 [Mortierella antarctica]|nr:hypothetical protein BGZ75_000584 [Mortierella antarctica]